MSDESIDALSERLITHEAEVQSNSSKVMIASLKAIIETSKTDVNDALGHKKNECATTMAIRERDKYFANNYTALKQNPHKIFTQEYVANLPLDEDLAERLRMDEAALRNKALKSRAGQERTQILEFLSDSKNAGKRLQHIIDDEQCGLVTASSMASA